MIPGSGRSSGERNGNSLQYSCLENSVDRGALTGYSPWGCKESDTTEQLTHTMSLQLRGLKDTQHILIQSPILAVDILCARHHMGYRGHMKKVVSTLQEHTVWGRKWCPPHSGKSYDYAPTLGQPLFCALWAA